LLVNQFGNAIVICPMLVRQNLVYYALLCIRIRSSIIKTYIQIIDFRLTILSVSLKSLMAFLGNEFSRFHSISLMVCH
jgi:hypothetical protein